MRYFIDCEFNSFQGELLALALIREDGHSRYWHKFAGQRLPTVEEVLNPPEEVKPVLNGINPWVKENVIPFLDSCPVTAKPIGGREDFARDIYGFLGGASPPIIYADWPTDIQHFCDSIQSGPGLMVPLDNIQFILVGGLPTEAYFIVNQQAVRHNAWWDAMALKDAVLDPVE